MLFYRLRWRWNLCAPHRAVAAQRLALPTGQRSASYRRCAQTLRARLADTHARPAMQRCRALPIARGNGVRRRPDRDAARRRRRDRDRSGSCRSASYCSAERSPAATCGSLYRPLQNLRGADRRLRADRRDGRRSSRTPTSKTRPAATETGRAVARSIVASGGVLCAEAAALGSSKRAPRETPRARRAHPAAPDRYRERRSAPCRPARARSEWRRRAATTPAR